MAQAYGFGVSVGRSLAPNPGSKLKGPDEEQCGIELVIQFADADNVWDAKKKEKKKRRKAFSKDFNLLGFAQIPKKRKEKSDRFSKDGFFNFFLVGKWKTL